MRNVVDERKIGPFPVRRPTSKKCHS